MSEVTEQGVTDAMNKGADPAYDAQECADVTRWLQRLEDARKFDENARKQYALDRRYARGDAGEFQVAIPIASSYIDILVSLLYARNPDLDVQPSDATQPPPMQDIIEMAREQIGSDPQTHLMMEKIGMQAAVKAEHAKQQAEQMAATQGLDPKVKMSVAMASADPKNQPDQIGEDEAQVWLNAKIQQEAKEIMQPYRKRLSEAKQFAKTIQIVVATLWKRAKLKAAAAQEVRSTLSIGPGWIKCTWQERMGQDPVVLKAIQDAQDQLKALEGAQDELESGEAKDDDALRAEIEQRLKGLEAKVEIIVARGLAIDFVRAEDVQVAQGCTLENYLDAPWIAHKAFKTKKEAVAEYENLEKYIKNATVYYQQKPLDPFQNRDVGEAARDNIDAKEAEMFSTKHSGNNGTEGEEYVCIWEIQDKSTGNIVTVVEGIKEKYAVPPYPPKPSARRFYSLFLLAFLWVDGERHPQSLVKRSARLFDEINRLYTNASTHRSRAIPKTIFDETNLDAVNARKIESGSIGELVGVKPTIPGTPVASMIAPIQYNKFDRDLYDTASIMRMLEIIWAVQEALASSVNVEKTATEAEIQQSGTNARTAFKRAAIDDVMDDLAMYTTEIALQSVSHEDAVQMAGPWAFWPTGMTVQDMDALVTVQIKGGSTGRPNTAQQQQAWATIFPLLKEISMQIGQLRGSLPSDIANSLEELVSETIARTGERFDASRFVPQEPSNEPGAMPTQPQQQGAQPPPGNGAAPQPMPQEKPPNQLPVPHKGHVPPDQRPTVQ